VIVLGKRVRRAAGFALALAGAAVFLGSLCSAGALARDLEVPTFLAPGVNPDQSPSSVPGGRPFELVTTLAVNRTPTLEEIPGPAANIRNLSFELSAGVVANAATFPKCTQEAFNSGACATAAQIGVANIGFSAGQASGTTPVFNMVPPPGMPAQFAFHALLSGVHINFRIRNGTDYGATAQVSGLSEAAGMLTSSVTIWGVPGDPAHDALRYTGNGVPAAGPYPEPPPFRPLLSNPTSCNGPLITTMEATTWQRPDQTTSAAAFEAPAMTDCNQLDFNPTIEAKPTTNLADSPSGLDLHLNIPQNQDHEGSASGHLRTARIVLPAGFGINPSAANGLGTCSPEQIGWVGSSDERQLLRYDLPPTNLSGSFVVSLAGRNTAPIPATATRAQVTAALETLPGLAGNISLSGAKGGWVVTFVGALAGTDVAGLTGTVADPPSQIVAVTGESGSFSLHFGGESTPALPFNASPEEVQEALRALPSFGLGNLFPGNVFVNTAGSVEITRSYQVFFVGDLAGTEPALTATSSLTGLEAGVGITPQPAGPPRSLSTATFGGIAPGTPQFTDAPVDCPNAAKIGTVRIDAPAVVGHPLEGNIYLASQGRNPFGSLLAIYIAVNDPATGLVLKLPGKIETDPNTGQLSASFSEAPQLPFEDLRLEFFKGTAAPLKTAIGCGDYVVNTDMVPWGAPEGAVRHPKDTFRIDKGAAAGTCVKDEASAPKAPGFEAGTIDPTAGIYSPFTLKLSRADGTQQLTGIDTTLPKGLLARLVGLHPCSDAALAAAATSSGKQEQASSSCPAASRVGTVNVRAGAGPTPFYTAGDVYLAGPYKGAPLSLAVVTPAVAGPFDLGTVVVRAALYVDPQSTQVHVVSDAFPSLLDGIALDLRSVALNLGAGQFTKNPTSCNSLTIGGSAAVLSGQSAPLSSRFQVGDCNRLAFKPKLDVALKGGTKRAAHPALKATLSNPSQGNYANIASASFSLPKSVRLDKTRIKPICTPAQYAAKACPPETAYGSATAFTTLLDEPLRGPVYLRSSSGKLPPELVVELKGAVDVVLAGRLETTKGGVVRASFENVPDVPISKFVLELQGTKKGLLENAANLCGHTNRVTALIDGQNAASAELKPVLTNNCKKARKGGKGKKRSGREAGR
jgi:hypothetical protein